MDRAGARVVLRWQEPLYRFAISDTLTLRFAAVLVRLGELATQEEVSQAFGQSVATQRRWENRYQERGLVGLEKVKSTGRPRRVPEIDIQRSAAGHIGLTRQAGVTLTDRRHTSPDCY